MSLNSSHAFWNARKSYLVSLRLRIKITKIVKHSLFNLMALSCDHKKFRCWLEEFSSSEEEGRKSLLGFLLDLSAYAINFRPFTFIFSLSRFCADNRFFYVFDLYNPAELAVVLLMGCSYTFSCLQCKHVTCVYTSVKNNWSGLRDLCCGKCLLASAHKTPPPFAITDWLMFMRVLWLTLHLSPSL